MPDDRGRTKVLHVTMKWGDGRGGVKQFILNAAEALDVERYEQFVLPVGPVTGSYLGLDVRSPAAENDDPVALATVCGKLSAAFLELDPDVVHIHCNNGLGLLYAYVARQAHCAVRVVHSHSTAVGDGRVAKRFASSALARTFSAAPTARVACSEAAGRHLFGRRSFEVVRNGINVRRFSFDLRARDDLRSKLGISRDALVLGHVGSGIPVKNAALVIDVVEALGAQDIDVYALLVGTGEEIDALRERAASRGLSERVRFLGVVSDVWRCYSAMDAFLLPSFYEGLPLSLVEAQANGLPCIASDVVSRESDIAGFVSFLSLEVGAKGWARAALEAARRGIGRDETISAASRSAIVRSGFSLETLGEQLEGLYRGVCKSKPRE